MHLSEFASSRTRVTLAAERTIIANNGLAVYGVVVSNTDSSGHNAQFRDADNNVLLDVEVAAGKTEPVNIKWLVDNGLKVREPDGNTDTVLVTVFHNNLSGAA